MTLVRILLTISLAALNGLGAASLPGDARQERASAPTGTLFGRVVDRDTGAPVRFATVQLVRIRLARITSITAGEDGTFAFPGLPPGTYFAAAASASHAPSFYSGGAGPAAEPGSAITVGRGEPTGPIEIRAGRGGVIAGTITDPNGDPAAGVPLQIEPWPPATNRGESLFYFQPRFIYSDSEGTYRAFGLGAGEYLVSAGPWFSMLPNDPVSGRRRKHQRVYFPNTTDPAVAVPVAVGNGQERLGIDVKLQITSLYKVTGTVEVPPDTKLDFISVRFQSSGRSVEGDQYDLQSTYGRTWATTEMPPGHYWVVATATEPYVTGPPAMEGRLWWATVPLTIGSDDISGVALALQSSSVVSGRIEFDGNAAVPGSEFGQWSVTLAGIPEAPSIVRRFPSGIPGRVNAAGQFTIRNITPGRYRLKLQSASTDTAAILGASIGGRALNGLELEITADTPNLNDLVLRVRR